MNARQGAFCIDLARRPLAGLSCCRIHCSMYVRETRRIVGRHVITENDLTASAGAVRPPCFEDSVGFTDWYMDSHACTRADIDDERSES